MNQEQEFPQAGFDYQLSLIKLLQRAALIHPREEIIYKNVFRSNYAEEYVRCQRLSNALQGLGVKKGSKVIAFEWNTHRHFEIYFGVPSMGAIMQMGNPFLTPQQITFIVNRAQVDVLVLNDELVPLIESISHNLESVRHYIITSDKGGLPPTKLSPVHEYEALLAQSSPEFTYPELDEKTIASLSNTTGTTGDPKICFFSHRQHLLHTMVWTIMLLGFSGRRGFDARRDLMIPLVPMFHAHGWSLPYMATLLGCRQVYPGRFEPTEFLKLLEQEKDPGQGGFMQCVPTLLDMVLSHPEIEHYKKFLRGIIYEGGGSRVPKKLAIRAQEMGIDVCAGWGMTEIYTKVALQYLKPHMFDWPGEDQLDFLTRTGMAVPLVEQRVVDHDMNDVPRDDKSIGEIVLRAPWLTGGYYKDPEASEELWRGGWLHSSDLATINQEESVLIADRNKDVIKSGGEWISSLTLESLLSTHPLVREVAIIGARSNKWGERPVAVVVPSRETDEATLKSELIKHLDLFVDQGKILRWWIPEKYVSVTELPKTSVGKLNKKEMRNRFRGVLED
ncbi:MAG: long-chain-fatty-acid--CoA ligase [Proteobacteria bacterium]|nr:long-chain-fatty-acid--CoA ligase [Pseudomonadota bacterium]MBU1451564.1 long-chain-fatty-acid--CoA ligase [Pseudomonadota bacterium]MBU2469647.1 long-chain-fatty-acid--CoA ligase [Pseudomonadota bacterium]MBU2516765.1 long-chain-fatty-acid--CoA ligase [Pseudomonadota bacterium]